MRTKASVKCGCGCGEEVTPGRHFRQGHDARFHGRVRKLAGGTLKLKELSAELGDSGKYAMPSYRKAKQAV